MKTNVATLFMMIFVTLPLGAIAIEPPEGVMIPYQETPSAEGKVKNTHL